MIAHLLKQGSQNVWRWLFMSVNEYILKGMREHELLELADLMKELGCVTAYNLDGGGSSTIWFNGKVLNQPTTFGDTIAEREVSDIVYIGK